MTDLMPLSDGPRAIIPLGGSVSYMTLWRAAIDGRVPAQKKGSRWFVSAADIPQIAAVFPASRAATSSAR